MIEPSNLDKTIDKMVGHAYEGHVLGQKNGVNEFAEFGVESAQDLKQFILKTMNDPETRGFIASKDGSSVYLYNNRDNVFIAIEPKKGGTAFIPKNMEASFEKELIRAKIDLGDNFLEVKAGGISALQNAFGEKFGHAMKMGPMALRRAFDVARDVTPRLAGRLLKIAVGIGTAATFMIGRAEAAELREKAHEAIAEGHLPPEALEDFEKILKAHQLQVNVDVSIIGNEVGVQEGFAKFVRTYEDHFKAHPEMLKNLEPPSLAEDLFGQEMDQNVMPQWAQTYSASMAEP